MDDAHLIAFFEMDLIAKGHITVEFYWSDASRCGEPETLIDHIADVVQVLARFDCWFVRLLYFTLKLVSYPLKAFFVFIKVDKDCTHRQEWIDSGGSEKCQYLIYDKFVGEDVWTAHQHREYVCIPLNRALPLARASLADISPDPGPGTIAILLDHLRICVHRNQFVCVRV